MWCFHHNSSSFYFSNHKINSWSILKMWNTHLWTASKREEKNLLQSCDLSKSLFHILVFSPLFFPAKFLLAHLFLYTLSLLFYYYTSQHRLLLMLPWSLHRLHFNITFHQVSISQFIFCLSAGQLLSISFTIINNSVTNILGIKFSRISNYFLRTYSSKLISKMIIKIRRQYDVWVCNKLIQGREVDGSYR